MGVNNNVTDLFGIIKYSNKYFNGVDVNTIYPATAAIWIVYIAIYISRIVLKKFTECSITEYE